jgi:hypothetical protein
MKTLDAMLVLVDKPGEVVWLGEEYYRHITASGPLGIEWLSMK